MKTKIKVLGIIFFCFAIFAGSRTVGRASLQTQDETEKKAKESSLQPAAEKVSEKPEEKPQPTPEATTKKNLSFSYNGEIANYVVSESHSFFGDTSRFWLETSLRLDTAVRYKHFTAGVSGIGIKTTGQDSFGTGTVLAGSPQGTNPRGTFPVSISTRLTSNSNASAASRSRPR